MHRHQFTDLSDAYRELSSCRIVIIPYSYGMSSPFFLIPLRATVVWWIFLRKSSLRLRLTFTTLRAVVHGGIANPQKWTLANYSSALRVVDCSRTRVESRSSAFITMTIWVYVFWMMGLVIQRLKFHAGGTCSAFVPASLRVPKLGFIVELLPVHSSWTCLGT